MPSLQSRYASHRLLPVCKLAFACYQGLYMLPIVLDPLTVVLDADYIIVCLADHSRSRWGHLNFQYRILGQSPTRPQ